MVLILPPTLILSCPNDVPEHDLEKHEHDQQKLVQAGSTAQVTLSTAMEEIFFNLYFIDTETKA